MLLLLLKYANNNYPLIIFGFACRKGKGWNNFPLFYHCQAKSWEYTHFPNIRKPEVFKWPTMRACIEFPQTTKLLTFWSVMSADGKQFSVILTLNLCEPEVVCSNVSISLLNCKASPLNLWIGNHFWCKLLNHIHFLRNFLKPRHPGWAQQGSGSCQVEGKGHLAFHLCRSSMTGLPRMGQCSSKLWELCLHSQPQ